MTLAGVDYSYGRPDVGCLAKTGFSFVGRYASRLDPPRSMSHGEAVGLVEAGLYMVTIYQPKGEKGWMTTGGLDRGKAAAREALDVAQGDCGMPEDRPIYFALDVEPVLVTPAGWAKAADTLAGAAAVLGVERVGLYGAYDAMARLMGPGKPARWGYQTSSWSGGHWWPSAHLRQHTHNVSRCGGLVDLVTAVAEDYGGWDDP